MQDNYYIVQVLLKKSLDSRSQVGEAALRAHMRCLLAISALWPPNVSVVTTLAEYFFKRLNEHFALPASGIMGYASSAKTPRNLLELCLPCHISSRKYVFILLAILGIFSN